MSKVLQVIHNKDFSDLHGPQNVGRHPYDETGFDKPACLDAVMGAVKDLDFPRDISLAPLATVEQIETVHSRAYFERLIQESAQSGPHGAIFGGSQDFIVYPRTGEAAMSAVGGVVKAVDVVAAELEGGNKAHVFVACRGAGSNAQGKDAPEEKAMMSSALSDVAIAARHAQLNHGLRVLVLNTNTEGGNGTEWALQNKPDTMFIDLRFQKYSYREDERKRVEDKFGSPNAFPEEVAQNVRRIYFNEYDNSHGYRALLESDVASEIIRFKPDIILWSLGLAAMKGDPDGYSRLNDLDVYDMTKLITSFGVPVVSVLEDGTVLKNLYDGTKAHLQGLHESLNGQDLPYPVDLWATRGVRNPRRRLSARYAKERLDGLREPIESPKLFSDPKSALFSSVKLPVDERLQKKALQMLKEGKIDPKKKAAVVLSLEMVEENLGFFKQTMKVDTVAYPVKTNPAPKVLAKLNEAGCSFEIASLGELQGVLDAGGKPDRVLFGHPVKIREEIEEAYAAGVRTFAFDTEQELQKLAELAPGSNVYIRLEVSNDGSEWELTEKFGAPQSEAMPLMKKALELGLNPMGLSFHVGWNNLNADTWQKTFDEVLNLARDAAAENIPLQTINLGGGFPAHNVDQNKALISIAAVTMPALDAMRNDFGLKIVAEPGSFLVTNTAVVVSQVNAIIERKGRTWVHIGTGVNQGFLFAHEGPPYSVSRLSEEQSTARDEPVIVTGPTCDSHDIFGMENKLPADIIIGDPIMIHPAGAYGPQSTERFNGFGWPDTKVF